MMSVPSISALTAGISFSACDAGAHEEAHEAELDAVALLELILVLVAHVHHRAHVDLVEGREHGGGVLRLLQPPRDGLAQPRHLHALLARGVVGRRRRAHCTAAAVCGDRRGRAAARSIAAIMSPLVTRPSLPEPSARSAGSMPVSAAILRTDGASGMSPARLGVGFGGAAAASARRRRSWRAAVGLPVGRRGLARRAGALLDLAEQRADRDGLAVLGGDVGQHAGGRRRHLDRHLVGLELDQRLVDRDRFARLLEPLADGRLGDGFAERGNADFSHGQCPLTSPRHARLVPGIHVLVCARTIVDGRDKPGHDDNNYPSASSSNCFSCA